MAVSPLVPRSPSATTSSSTVPQKLKEVATQNILTAQGPSHPPVPSQKPGYELAQQLNEDVRHKYIKGI